MARDVLGGGSDVLTDTTTTITPRLRLVTPLASAGRVINDSTNTLTALTPRGVRVECPLAGKLHDVAVFATISGGNYMLLVYDTGDAAGGAIGTRTLLWAGSSSGQNTSAAVGSVGWSTGDPNITVTQGQQLDLLVVTDSATPSFGRLSASSLNSPQLPTSSFNTVPGGALPKLAFTYPAIAALNSGSLATTVIEGSVANSASATMIIGRIS